MGIVRWIADRWDHRSRQIFEFWDGSRTRGVDPLLVLRQLSGHPEFNIEVTPQLCEVADPKVSLPAIELTLRAVREVFGLQVYGAAGGLTDGETLALMGTFGDYIAALKKNTSQSVTLPAATVPPVCPASTMNAASV